MTFNLDNTWQSRELQDIFIKYDIQSWLSNEVFTWRWWILVGFLIIPWIIWFRIYDRKRSLEILMCGSLVVIATTYLDAIGSDLRFWMYPVELIPITPRAIAFDMEMVAIAYMLLFQYFRSWKYYLIFLTIGAGVFAFIGEPFAHSMQLVYYIRWHYWYSFFYYIILGVSVKLLVNKVK